MSATTTAPPVPPQGTTLSEPARPSLLRLTLVELRKSADTRSGRWLLIIVALCTPVLMPVILFTVPAQDQTMREFFVATQAAAMLLLPVLGILSVTSEWSQRTALTTFALVPDRSRVLVAKLLASLVPATAFVVLGVGVAAASRALGGAMGRSEGSWSLPPELVGGVLLASVIWVVMGVAFGMLLGSPALAIVLYFVLPTLWSMLGAMVKKVEEAARWLDTNQTVAALNTPGMTGGEWAKLGTSVAVWVVLPLLIGLIRLVRREVK
jgi:ABC-2 type transport system permease protein